VADQKALRAGDLVDIARVSSAGVPRPFERMSYHSKWLIGLVPYVLVVVLGTWKPWWSTGPALPGRDPSARRTIYQNVWRPVLPYSLAILSFYYAAYVIVSLALGRLAGTPTMLHLAFWTLAPPVWFFFEWFVWFDNHESAAAVASLRVAQDLSSRFWAAVLAVMLAYRLGDIVKAQG
jgi:hypothetical protein